MEFLAPLMLVGALGVAVPVVIHLIGRRRAKVVQFAALDFLLGSNRKVARRLQLRELLLLLTRIFVCLAIPLALAKPFTTCASKGAKVERGPQGAVLVVDDSYAMTYSDGDTSLLTKAKDQARSILTRLGPEADVAIVLASEGSDSPRKLSRDHIRLRDSIGDIRATSRPADITTALKRAAQLLATSSHQRRTVFVMSAMSATAFRGNDPPWPAGAGITLTVVDMAKPGSLRNVAVTDLEVEADPTSGTRGVRVTAEIANFGPKTVTKRGVALRIAKRVVARGLVDLRPGQRQKKRFLATLPENARTADVIVEIDDDPLRADNRRFVRMQLRDEVRTLLVNGDPRTVRYEDELFYLHAALRPGDRGDSGTVLTTATVDQLEKLPLGEFDVIVLANVPALAEKRAAKLAAWVRGGGGLLVAPGDLVDADAYNRTMLSLLPQRLKSALDLGYGASGKEKTGRALRLTKFDPDHEIFTVFTKDAPGLREATFRKIMLLGPTSRVDDRKVLARYTNGAAAIVEARSGKGRLLLFTSTIDRDWTDLPIHPGFLPLTQQSVRYLARKQSRRNRAPILVGRGTALPVKPDDKRLEVRSPTGKPTVIEGDALSGKKFTRFTETKEPGFYRVFAADKTGKSHQRSEANFAVNLDPRGSDLRYVKANLLPASSAPGEEGESSTHKRKVELWHGIAIGLLMLLLVESVLTLR